MSSHGYSGGPNQTDNWSKNKPDAEGRKHPFVDCTLNYNTRSSITETQTIVRQDSSTKVKLEPLKDYGYGEDKWRKSLSLVHDHPPKVEKFLTKGQTEASTPRFGLKSALYWLRGRNSTGQQKNTGYGDHDDIHRKKQSKPTTGITTDDYLKEANKPSSFAASPHSRVNVPKGPKIDDDVETFNHGKAVKPNENFISSHYPAERSNVTTYGSEVARPYESPSHSVEKSAVTVNIRETKKPDDHFKSSSHPVEKSTVTIDDKEVAKISPPKSSFSKPTKDITAVGFLKEATKISSSQENLPIPMEPERNDYLETNREAARSSAEFNTSSQLVAKSPVTSDCYHRDHDDIDTKKQYKRSGNAIGEEKYIDPFQGKGSDMQPTKIDSGGWVRPRRAGGVSPPKSSFSKPTKDIAAVDFLKEDIEDVKCGNPIWLKSDDYPESKWKAAGPYANLNTSSRDSMKAVNSRDNSNSSPLLSDHKHGSTTKVKLEPLKDYGFGEDEPRISSSPIDDRPPKVEGFFTEKETKASRPKFDPFSEVDWLKTRNSKSHHENTVYPDHFQEKCNKMQPTMINSGGWTTPSGAGSVF